MCEMCLCCWPPAVLSLFQRIEYVQNYSTVLYVVRYNSGNRRLYYLCTRKMLVFIDECIETFWEYISAIFPLVLLKRVSRTAFHSRPLCDTQKQLCTSRLNMALLCAIMCVTADIADVLRQMGDT